MTGLLLIDKPEGLTSFGALMRVKRIISQKKCGHTGTLDPMATGVLTVLLGGATRFSELLPDHNKAYIAKLRLGTVTDTLDITGKVLEENPVTATKEDFIASLAPFRGEISQLPPMYSAVSVNGKRLYELAREGKEVERTPRTVFISELELISADEDKNEYEIRVGCSSGTYIRTLADDIGRALGCGATLVSLRRTLANSFTAEQTLTLEELEQAVADGRLEEYILPLDKALEYYPAVTVSEKQAVRFLNGGALALERLGSMGERIAENPGYYRVYSPDGVFLGLGEAQEEELKVKRVNPDAQNREANK